MTYKHTLAALFLITFSGVLFATECLSPGQYKNDFNFSGTIVNDSLVKKARTGLRGVVIQPEQPVSNPGIYGSTKVQVNGNNIQLVAFANNITYTTVFRKIESFARGKLYVDFSVDCGSTLNDTISATLSFHPKILGRISTFYPGSKAVFQVAARITDLDENRIIDYRLLENQSVGNLLGSFKIIAKLPVVVPQTSTSELAPVQNFVLNLRRGHTYRFELFAAARATTGYVANPGSSTLARVDFLENNVEFPGYSPGVEITDFSLDVATDSSAEIEQLKAAVESLQQSLSTLSDQVTEQDASHREQLEEINNLIAGQREDIILLQNEQALTDQRQDTLEQKINDIEDHLTKTKGNTPRGRWLQD